MENKKIIIANLKMNLNSRQEREEYIRLLNEEIERHPIEERLIICPQFIHLEKFLDEVRVSDNIAIGSQDIFWEDSGSYTGEISPVALKSFGFEYAIIGHSERRNYCGEANHIINAKIKGAIRNGIRPIFCVGETLEERESGKTKDSIEKQVSEGIQGIDQEGVSNIIFAYEPIWSVGTNLIPSSEDISEVRNIIRETIKNSYGIFYIAFPI